MLESKICIVGFGDTRKYAPWADRSWTFWGFNDPFEAWKNRADYPFSRWFQLHQRGYLARGQENLRSQANFALWSLDWYQSLRTLPLYVWNPTEWPECPTAVAYPIDRISGLPRPNYHLSSVDWLVALAIAEGAKVISIYGVDFGPTEGGEPYGARACLEYWLGMAEGRGIATHVEGGALFHTYQFLRSTKQYGREQYFNEVDALRID